MCDNNSMDLYLCRLEEPNLDLYIFKCNGHEWALDCDAELLAMYFNTFEVLQFTDHMSLSKTVCIGQLMSNKLDSHHVCPILSMDTIVSLCEKCFDSSVINMFFQICELNLPNFRAYNLSTEIKREKGKAVVQTSAGDIWPFIVLAEALECKIMSTMLINRLHSILCSPNCQTPNMKLPRQLLDGIPSESNSLSMLLHTFREHFHNFPFEKSVGDVEEHSSIEDISDTSFDYDENMNPNDYNPNDRPDMRGKRNLDCSTSIESCESIYVDVDVDNVSDTTSNNERMNSNSNSRRLPTPEPYPLRGNDAQYTNTNYSKIESRDSMNSQRHDANIPIVESRSIKSAARPATISRASLGEGSSDRAAAHRTQSPTLALRRDHLHRSSNNYDSHSNNNDIKNRNKKSFESGDNLKANNSANIVDSRVSPMNRSQSPKLSVQFRIARDTAVSPNGIKRSSTPLATKSDSSQMRSPAASSVDDSELQKRIAVEKELRAQEARRRATERIKVNKKLIEDKKLKEKHDSASKMEKKWALRDKKISNFVERQQKGILSPGDIIAPKQSYLRNSAGSEAASISEPWNVFDVKEMRSSLGEISNYNSKQSPDAPLKRASITPIKKFSPKELHAVGLTPSDVCSQTETPLKEDKSRQNLVSSSISRADSILRDAREFKSLLDNSLNESFDRSVDLGDNEVSTAAPDPAMKLFKSPVENGSMKPRNFNTVRLYQSDSPISNKLISSPATPISRPKDSVDMITVTILRAWGLKPTLSGTNPYVVVDWGSLGRAATQAVSSTTSPQFSSFLKFKSPFKPLENMKKTVDNMISFNGKAYCLPSKSDAMRISVYSRNKIVSDELIGESIVDADKLLGYFLSVTTSEDGVWDESTQVSLTVPLIGLDQSSAGNVEVLVALDSDHSIFIK